MKICLVGLQNLSVLAPEYKDLTVGGEPVASDSDCDRSRLLVHYARDRWLYAYGLRRADAILVQSDSQARSLSRSYGLASRVAGMLVEPPMTAPTHDLDVLWVGNVRRVKRPDRVLWLSARLPHVAFHMVGGALPGEEALYAHVRNAAAACANLTFHGRLSYADAGNLYGRARLLLNTADVEGFPNSYLQAWVRGVPVVTLIDPDGVIGREGLGIATHGPDQLPGAIASLLGSHGAWQAASDRCRRFMAREFGDDSVMPAYLETFEHVMRAGMPGAKAMPSSAVLHG